MIQQLIKKWSKHIIAIIIFAALTILYFAPAVIEGKTLLQSDNIKAVGMGSSQMKQYEETAEPGEFSVWSDAMFSGMPYIAKYGSPTPDLPGFRLLEQPLRLFSPGDAAIVFTGLICFYILMCVMGVNWWLALAGTFAFAFASYNIIILVAGHIVKGYVIAYMPLTLAGMILLFKKNYLWGSLLFILGVAFSITNGHIQITYYLLLLCLFIYIGYVVSVIKEKEYKEIGKVTGIMFICVILAVLPNTKKLYSDWELGQHSTRGGTELTTTGSDGEKISSGLDKEYAFQWSYGKGELLTLLIPNIYGGSSGETLDSNSELYQAFRKNGIQVGKDIQAPAYWGDKPSTSGPVYFGAFVCFLFILGMFIIKNPMKWWLFAGALFLTLLALGKNLDWFNDFMFHYLPIYNKFRTVEMALVIPGMVFPIIAMWGLKVIFTQQADENSLKKGFITALSITGGLCLLIWLTPGLFLSFQSNYDLSYGLPDWYLKALWEDREHLASSDALRSLIIIIIGAGLLYWFFKAKEKTRTATYVSIGIAVLILVDLWTVDRRYINESTFMNQKPNETYVASVADKEIFKDQDPSFRVINLNNPFQETSVSYFHKSIGGYHAAKLRRYQDLTEHRLIGEITNIIRSLQEATTPEDLYSAFASSPSLNMLNTRYIIYNPEQPPLRNPFAFGNAWFVNKVDLVENADAEIAALNSINPLEEAVVDRRFGDQLQGFIPTQDSTAMIRLDSYRPNRLIYTSRTASEQVAIFSEIYYQPGWHAFIDGEPTEHFRADWTLRGMRIPAGEHQIVFEFYPDTYVKAAYIETFSSFLILLLVLGTIVYSGWKYWEKEKNSEVMVGDPGTCDQ